ncbi:PREDICTED: protein FAR1-RELATED SEQUENCE 5-like [Ipomoea nil]|uniref:protein FAR1-RELATED SEQUENCE 5-like n=1 Tax=Ipomoea nil TaxID=35883 RepID=UPI0009019037|nr:PREDICTED: protein FAR1-RELATED SEQUENCE 5-like [Ipomoea nil]
MKIWVGIVVSNSDEAYELCNGYAYRVGFSVRKCQQRYKASTKSIQMKRFFCAKVGYKEKPNSGVKVYSKIDIRTGYGTLVQFDVDGNGMWTVTKHVKEHNHELCSFGKSHLPRSHRRVGNNHLEYLKDMKKSGVALADAMATAISIVFPTSRHHICIWHIGENSKKHIKALRNHNDFLDMFNCLLKYTETEAEFEFYWTSLEVMNLQHRNNGYSI